MNLKNAVCVVTGATEGIGRAIAEALAARKAQVAICARTSDKVTTAVAEMRAKELSVVGTHADVSIVSDVDRFRDFVHAELGPVDVLVNNAGLGFFGPIDKMTVEEFDTTMSVNVRGVFLMTRAFLPDMRKRKSGEIVNIASLAGKNAYATGTVYAASKHAVLGFSKSLMLEVRKDNIRVIAVCPGSVDTPFFDKAGEELNNADRVLTAEDVAQTVVAALELPGRAMISELDIRPTNP
jgi:3-oxoacyl-[acyl-carrier protein] reductase